MILHLVKCEMCDNQFSFQPMQQAYHKAPDAWLVLYHAKDIHVQDGWHFCSVTCLNRWIITGHPELSPAHLAHVGEQGPNERAYFNAQAYISAQEIDHEPYPFCCEKHYVLGNFHVDTKDKP